MHAIAITTVIVVLLAARPGGWPAPPPDARQNKPQYSELRFWLDAVARHRAGEFDRPAVDIAPWSERELRSVAEDLQELSRFLVRAHALQRQSGQTSTLSNKGRSISMGEAAGILAIGGEDARSGDLTGIVTRAALLHTDIAIMLDRGRDRPAAYDPGAAASAMVILDGRRLGLVGRSPHWPIARLLLGLRHGDAATDVPLRWYRATSAYMQSRSRFDDLVPHLAGAREIFPDDADILFGAGVMHEAMASPEPQTIRDVQLPPGTKAGIMSARAHLGEARAAFRRAVEQKPDFIDARVRLGRVLSLLGQHADAARELERVPATAGDDHLRYFAALFLGSAQEALGRRDAAVAAFERAAALYPRAQSPQLALSRLARAAGDHRRAVTALHAVLALPALESERDDPWWRYYRASESEAVTLVNAWRRSVEVATPR